ncbi:MAG TPA: hypothetical protein VN673_00590, partial [Clostridia bacterium]|nr:hypothetical protein [Clostridia bacterium]
MKRKLILGLLAVANALTLTFLFLGMDRSNAPSADDPDEFQTNADPAFAEAANAPSSPNDPITRRSVAASQNRAAETVFTQVYSE